MCNKYEVLDIIEYNSYLTISVCMHSLVKRTHPLVNGVCMGSCQLVHTNRSCEITYFIHRLAWISQSKSSITSEYCAGISYLEVCIQ